MKVKVLLEFCSKEDYENAMWDIHDAIPTLVEWRELEIVEEES